MSGNFENIKKKLSVFFRYHSGQMSGRERNAFERNLQKDPFTEDALKGFEQTGQEQAEKDIKDLMSRLDKRISNRNRIIWYRVAASVAVLMIISSVFLFIERNRPQRTITRVPEQVIPDNKKEIPELPVVAENTPPKIETREKQKSPEKKMEEPSKPELETVRESEPAVSIAENADAATASKGQETETQAKSARLTEIPAETRPSEYKLLARGKVISAVDNTPMAGVNISVKGTNEETVTDKTGNFDLKLGKPDSTTLVASFTGMKTKEFKAAKDSIIEVTLEPSIESLSDIITVGHSTEKGTEKGYVPPRPLDGKASFDKYLKDNLRRPVSLPAGQRVVVVLELKVESEGKIDSITVIRSPSEVFSEEAIRLIRNGPDWKPGEINGKPVSDEVMLRIVFR